MKQVIWKYELKETLSMPSGSKIMCVQTQNNIPCLWVICNPDSPEVSRNFLVLGTGHVIIEPITIREYYIGTYQINGGEFVFHVFEKR